MLARALNFEERAEALERIEGWFSSLSHATWDVLLAYQQDLGVLGNLLEIGVWHGRSAAVLASYQRDGETLALIDPMMQTDRITEAFARVGVTLAPERHALLENRTSDMTAARDLWDLQRSVRFMHIDGEHTASGVQRDLELAHDLLRDDAVCVLDDFFNVSYPQVTQALYEYLAQHPGHFRLFLGSTRKGYLCRPSRFYDYYTFCLEQLRPALLDRGIEVLLKKTSSIADSPTLSIVQEDEGREYRGPDWDEDSLETLTRADRPPGYEDAR